MFIGKVSFTTLHAYHNWGKQHSDVGPLTNLSRWRLLMSWPSLTRLRIYVPVTVTRCDWWQHEFCMQIRAERAIPWAEQRTEGHGENPQDLIDMHTRACSLFIKIHAHTSTIDQRKSVEVEWVQVKWGRAVERPLIWTMTDGTYHKMDPCGSGCLESTFKSDIMGQIWASKVSIMFFYTGRKMVNSALPNLTSKHVTVFGFRKVVGPVNFHKSTQRTPPAPYCINPVLIGLPAD